MESMATPTLPTSPPASGMIGIETDLRGQIKCDRQSGSPVSEQIFVAFIGFFGISHARILAHGPQASAIHRGLHTASEGILSRVANFGFVVGAFEIDRSVEGLYRNVRGSLDLAVGCGRGLHFLAHGFTGRKSPIVSKTQRLSQDRERFFRTLQNELTPNQAKVTAQHTVTATLPTPT